MAWTATIDGYHVVLSMTKKAIDFALADRFVRAYAKDHSLPNAQDFVSCTRDRSVANYAADWELDQCCATLEGAGYSKLAVQLRYLRRPMTPVARLKEVEQLIEKQPENWQPSPAQWSAIREALKEARYALTDKEN